MQLINTRFNDLSDLENIILRNVGIKMRCRSILLRSLCLQPLVGSIIQTQIESLKDLLRQSDIQPQGRTADIENVA